MALPSDSSGFLVGERIEVDSETMGRSLAIWKEIRDNGREMLLLMKGGNGRVRSKGGAAKAADTVSSGVATPARAGAATRAKAPAAAASPQRAGTGAAGTSPAAAARPRREVAPRERDAKGRFIRADAGSADQGGKGSGGANSGGGKRRSGGDSGDGGSARAPNLDKAVSAITDAVRNGIGTAATGTEQVDPIIGAAKEIRDLAAPITKVGSSAVGGLFGMFRDRQERRKRRLDANENAKAEIKEQIPWYRRILKAIDSKPAGADGGGLLSGLIGALAGRLGLGGVGGALGSIAGGAGIAGMAGGAAAGAKGLLKGVGTKFLPFAAIISAIQSFSTSTEDYAKRMGTRSGEGIIKDAAIRMAGVLSDLGNLLTLGLADRLGNLMAGNGFVRSKKPVANPNPGAQTAPSGTVKAGASSTAPAVSRHQAGPLLDMIGKEGGRAGYDAFWNGSRVKPAKPMSEMTFAEVKQWQRDTLNEQASRGIDPKRRSSAAGRYQFMSGTLPGVMQSAGLKDTDKFNAENQDKLAVALLNKDKSRGLSAWMGGKATDAQFSDFVASQWALFQDSRGVGQYDKAGFNKATIPASDVIAAARKVRAGPGAAPVVPTTAAPPVRASAAPSATPIPPPPGSMRTGVAPTPGQYAIPPAPSVPTQIGSSKRTSAAVEVTIPVPVGQNVNDRGIAQVATGGMGGSGMGQRVA